MSIGNLKDSGNQGNNFPWQLKMLVGQQCACDELAAINANTDDVEFLLSAILTSLQANTEYEAKFVVDTCDSNKVYLEVRLWDSDSSTWGPITYYLPGSSTPVTPVGASTPGCLIYTDPSGILGMILAELQLQTPILTDIEINTGDTVTELQSILALYSAGPQACADSLSVTLCTEQGTSLSNIETNTTGLATEVTLGNIYTELQGGITVDAIDLDIRDLVFATDKVDVSGSSVSVSNFPATQPVSGPLTDAQLRATAVPVSGTFFQATQPVSAASLPLPTGAATETTLAAVNTKLTSVSRTPNFLRPTGVNGTIAAGTFSMSFASVGTADATVGGMVLKPGETINFDAGALNNTLGAVAYSTTTAGAELIIITLT